MRPGPALTAVHQEQDVTPPLPFAPAPAREKVKLDPDLETRLVLMEQERIRQERWRTRVWRERRALLLLLFLVLLLLPNFRMARVVGRSMEPQFRDGQSLLVWKSWRRFGPLRPGDIIVFRHPDPRLKGQELVKRVWFVQNARGTARWPDVVLTARGPRSPSDYFPVYVLRDRPAAPFPPRGTVWVVGDNFENSSDSRDFGPIRPETILGKVILR